MTLKHFIEPSLKMKLNCLIIEKCLQNVYTRWKMGNQNAAELTWIVRNAVFNAFGKPNPSQVRVIRKLWKKNPLKIKTMITYHRSASSSIISSACQGAECCALNRQPGFGFGVSGRRVKAAEGMPNAAHQTERRTLEWHD